MNKLKDIIYNKNDLVIVLVILVLAGLLIWNRVEALSDYPKILIANAQEQGLLYGDPDKVEVNPGEDQEPPDDAVMYAVYINPGDSLQTIGGYMVSVGLFPTVSDFVSLIEDMGLSTQVKTGNFIIPSTASPSEVIDIIIKPGL
ncbi:MAG: hypothetical protein WCY49_05360 [Anaerovoracaceae bacterium]|nr:endolytic transglycosylase MltG [Clostridiales bacterium]